MGQIIILASLFYMYVSCTKIFQYYYLTVTILVGLISWNVFGRLGNFMLSLYVCDQIK